MGPRRRAGEHLEHLRDNARDGGLARARVADEGHVQGGLSGHGQARLPALELELQLRHQLAHEEFDRGEADDGLELGEHRLHAVALLVGGLAAGEEVLLDERGEGGLGHLGQGQGEGQGEG